MSEWHPIETAPKDCRVLTYGPLRDGSGFYYEVQQYRNGRHARWPIEWMDNSLAPTHWMPLPKAPQS